MGLFRHSTYVKLLCYLLVMWTLFIVFAAYNANVNGDRRRKTVLAKPPRMPDLEISFRSELAEDEKDDGTDSGSAGLKSDEKQILQNDFDIVPQLNALYTLPSSSDSEIEPNQQYESSRRKIQKGVQEFWWFVSSEVKKMRDGEKHLGNETNKRLDNLLSLGNEHKRSLLKDINQLKKVDGFANWRDKEFRELGSLIQRRIRYVQNPVNCASTKKLVCDLQKICGFGCQMHHISYCLIMAYGTERTLVLKSKNWCYNRSGWNSVFLPLSETCFHFESSSQDVSLPRWKSIHNDSVVLELPYIDHIEKNRPDFLPLAVPKDIVSTLEKMHGKPTVWWVGQFVKYIFRYQPSMEDMLNQFALKNNFSHPIVGVQIRRTDKIGREASFHSVEEYMSLVEEYYEQLKMNEPVPVKRIYLATDEPQVFSEIKKKYPDYTIIGDPKFSRSAAKRTRCTKTSRDGVITDVHFLAHSDFLVCTFSSQICRLAYEFMNSLVPDASENYRSLDDVWYFGGQSPHLHKAVLPHKAQNANELSFKTGDVLHILGNHWDGYSKGINKMLSSKVGALFPSFKVMRLTAGSIPDSGLQPSRRFGVKYQPNSGMTLQFGDTGTQLTQLREKLDELPMKLLNDDIICSKIP